MACECTAPEEVSERDVLEIVQAHKSRPGPLIPILDEIQTKLGWLPKWALIAIARELGVPVADIYGVASFYSFFRLTPPGRTRIQVCMGTACYVRGSAQLLDALERKLKIKAGETTPDREFTLESVRCVGACSLAPVIVSGEDCNAGMTTAKIDKMLKACAPKEAVPA